MILAINRWGECYQSWCVCRWCWTSCGPCRTAGCSAVWGLCEWSPCCWGCAWLLQSAVEKPSACPRAKCPWLEEQRRCTAETLYKTSFTQIPLQDGMTACITMLLNRTFLKISWLYVSRILRFTSFKEQNLVVWQVFSEECSDFKNPHDWIFWVRVKDSLMQFLNSHTTWSQICCDGQQQAAWFESDFCASCASHH